MKKNRSLGIGGWHEEIILHSLLEKDRFGGEIADLLNKITEGEYKLNPSQIYISLRKLEDCQFIKAYNGDRQIGSKRIYYSITDAGQDAIAQKAAILKVLKVSP
jgi:PadR family transcriptional regulator, regulatory protein PadR